MELGITSQRARSSGPSPRLHRHVGQRSLSSWSGRSAPRAKKTRFSPLLGHLRVFLETMQSGHTLMPTLKRAPTLTSSHSSGIELGNAFVARFPDRRALFFAGVAVPRLPVREYVLQSARAGFPRACSTYAKGFQEKSEEALFWAESGRSK